MKRADLDLLMELLSQPTAPFCESFVMRFCAAYCERWQIPYFADPLGNLVLGASSKAAYLRRLREKSQQPLRLFIAHTDHPGFQGVRWSGDGKLSIRWHGGSPVRHLSNSTVWLASAAKGYVGTGKFKQVKLAEHGRAIASGIVHVAADWIRGTRPAAEDLFGGFGFSKPAWRQGSTIYTKAADDLVGVYAVLRAAQSVYKSSRSAEIPFLGLLTRAEEVGFVGAIGHFELGWLQRASQPPLVVSLEASRTLPGALVGSGPVVRLGDRRTVFDPSYLQALVELAQARLPEKFQRRIMDGGSCEATAATAYGFPTIGLSVPLGNYHNQGLEGGAECRKLNGPAPEFVHIDDVEGLVTLCQGVVGPRFLRGDPWQKLRSQLRKNYRDYKKLL